MLRHFKMEIKRQAATNTLATDPFSNANHYNQTQMQQQQQQQQLLLQQQQHMQQMPMATVNSIANVVTTEAKDQKSAHRVRGRRSSKPMMEKRRRARINQCMDILKFYVLNDTSNLSRLGIDLTTRENHNEETIARTILKTSGLINRHRGRKNPNKLEKADILELTVDYVRRLHEQREELIQRGQNYYASGQPKQQVTTTLANPLTLTLPSIGIQSTPPTPPSSSASSSPQSLLSISNNVQHQAHSTTISMTTATVTSTLPDVLDLSDSRRARAQQY